MWPVLGELQPRRAQSLGPLLEAPGHVLCGNTEHLGKAISTVLRGGSVAFVTSKLLCSLSFQQTNKNVGHFRENRKPLPEALNHAHTRLIPCGERPEVGTQGIQPLLLQLLRY